MWLVVDTNQAGLIPSTLRGDRASGRANGITLPLYTLAEILRRGQQERSETLSALTRHNVRIGLEPDQAFRFVSQLPHDEIPSYEPFPPASSQLETEYARLLLETNVTVSPEAANWSAARVSDAERFEKRVKAQSEVARKLVRENRPDKPDTVDEMLVEMGNGPDSFVGRLILTELFPASGANDRSRLFELALQNHFLRHFFHAMAHYLVSISKGWKDQRRNNLQLHRDVARNDWIDLVLALYVGSDDIVVSDDWLHRSVLADLGVSIVSASDL